MNEETKQPFFAGCLTWGLTGLAALLSFFSFMGRAEGREQVHFAVGFALVVIGPMWAAVVILCGRAARARKWKTYLAAVLAWALVGGGLAWLEVTKMKIRLSGAERAMERARQNMEDLEQHGGQISSEGAASAPPNESSP